MWDLWSKSGADVREKWRYIANVVREGNAFDRPDELREILQMVFWVGAVLGTAGEVSRGRAGLGGFLPETSVDALLGREGVTRKHDCARASA